MAHEKAIAEALDSLWGKSLERNWIVGRLGLAGVSPTFNVPDRPGYKYVNKGIEGEQGQVFARDKIGVSDVFNQRVRMRREFGEYVIREAEYLDSSGGLSNTLAGLTDVAITSVADGDIIVYDSDLGEWVNAAAGGGGGTTYYEGSAIDIDGSNAINVQVNSSSAIVVDTGSNTLMVNAGDGLKIATNLLTLSLATNPGLEYSTGQVRVKAGDGITVGAGGVALDFATDPGLEISSGNVRVKEYFGIERSSNGIGVKLKTTSGLVVDIAGVAVGAGDGIDVLTSTIAVDVTDIIDTAAGIKEDASNNIQVRLETNSGLQFGGAGGVQLGTPTTATVSSTNTVSTTTHNHAITSSSDVGTTPVASILASNSSGQLTLAQLTLRGNLVFAGGNRSITASNNLTISPSSDLILDPTGLVLTPNAQDIRTVTINDLPTGIDGYRIWNRYANYTQLTIGAIKADELYVRVFVADETRIDRGEEYWSKSFGIVQEDFTLPAVNSTVDVWFEDAPAAVTFDLFAVNDYLLMRTIDWGTGLVVQKVWFRVTAAKLDQETTAVEGVDRQQWRIRRLQGGVNGSLIKRGNLALDTGAIGQGWVHLSALSQDGGPFIQIGSMTSVATVPQFSNYTRMGNLNGTVDYATNVYGFAAGDDLGTTPSGGFSGMAAEATNGLRLFNTDLDIYNSSTLVLSVNRTNGVQMRDDSSQFSDARRYISWHDSLPSGTRTSVLASWASGGSNLLDLYRTDTTGTTSVRLLVDQSGSGEGIWQVSSTGGASLIQGIADEMILGSTPSGMPVRIWGRTSVAVDQAFIAVSVLHVHEDNNTTGSAAGVTIEQDGTGDALLQFYLTSTRRWVVGIDNSDSDMFKISNNAVLGTGDVLTIDTSGNIYFGTSIYDAVNNRLGVGGTDPVSAIEAISTSTSAARGISSSQHNAGAQAAIFNFYKSRGNRASQNTVANGDFLGDFVFQPYDGTSYLRTAQIAAKAVGTVTTGSVPTDLLFAAGATDDASLSNVRMTIKSSGLVGVGIALPISPLHIYESTSATTTAAGVTIEQNSTGDAKVQFLLTGGQRWGVGIDNSASDALVIAPGTDLSSSPSLTITTGGITGTGGHLGVGTITPGVDVISTTDITAGKMIHIEGDTSTAKLVLTSDTSASISLIGRSGGTGEKWFQIVTGTGLTNWRCFDDSGGSSSDFVTMDHATGYVGINNLVPDARLDVDTEDNNGIRSTVYSATNWFNFVSRRTNGTKASPTRALLNTIIGSWGGQGYTLSGWGTIASAQIQMRAAENYTATAQGSKIEFYTTLDGTTTISKAVTIENDGALIVPYIWSHAVNGTAVQVDSTGLLTKATSSIRFKKNVRAMPGDFGDDFVMALKPIVYNNKFGDDANDYVGFVAEDVFGIGGKPFISFNDDGLVESLHYDKLTVPLVAAVQDLIPYKARIAQLEGEMAELRARVYALEGE